MFLFRIAMMLAALTCLAMAPVPGRNLDAGDEEKTAVVQLPEERIERKSTPAEDPKPVVLTYRAASTSPFSVLDQVIQDVTGKLQTKIADDFDRFLERKLESQRLMSK